MLSALRFLHEQVEQLLLDDPGNEEYQNIYNDLCQVVSLTEDLLSTVTEQQQVSAEPSVGPLEDRSIEPHPQETRRAPVVAITSAPEVKLPSVLPPQVAELSETGRKLGRWFLGRSAAVIGGLFRTRMGCCCR